MRRPSSTGDPSTNSTAARIDSSTPNAVSGDGSPVPEKTRFASTASTSMSAWLVPTSTPGM